MVHVKKIERKSDRLKWFLYRWRRMVHPQEDVYRLKQYIQNNLLDRFNTKYVYKLSAKENASFVDTESLKSYKQNTGSTYRVFQQNIPISYNDWRTDAKTGTTSQKVFKSHIDQKNIKAVGENRYVYELNRLHVLPALAIAAGKGNSESICQINSIISSWQKENPFLHSINWKSGIEVGIRAVNLVITRLLLRDISAASSILNPIDLLLSYHYAYLKNHLSLFSSANNHLLKELLGLIAISAVYNFENQKKELTYYFKYFQKELLKQTFEDGGSKEQSVHYHAAVLNASFLALHFAEKNKLEPRPDFIDRLKNMCIFLDEMTLGGKTESLFGDKDDSNIVYDVFADRFNLYHSLLTTGKHLLGIEYSYYKCTSTDLLNTLLYADIKYVQTKNTVIQKKDYTFFPASGYFLFNNLPLNSKLYFDVGPLGFEPIAAHGHSDLLHFTLWVDDEPFIVDSGTYQYNPYYLKWREYFRGITSHNTVSVNKQQHAKSLGVMLWGKPPLIKTESCGEDKNGNISCTACHTAFKNNSGTIKHTRKISAESNEVIIIDRLDGKGSFEVSFYLHFHPDVKPELIQDELHLSKNNKRIKLNNELFSNAKLEYGNDILPLGWYSNRYDAMVKTHALYFSVNVVDTTHFTTRIKFG